MKPSDPLQTATATQSASARPSRRRRLMRFCLRWAKRACIFIACLATLTALLWAIEDWRGARAWQHALQQMDEAEPGWRIPPQIPEIPPEQDAARHPVFAAYLRTTPAGPASFTGYTRESWTKELEWLSPKTGMLRDRKLPPLAPLKLPSGLPDLPAWNQAAAEILGIPETEPGTTFPALREALRRSEHLMNGVLEAFSCPQKINRGLAGMESSPEGKITRLLEFRVLMALADQRWDAAVSEWESAYRVLGGNLSDCPDVGSAYRTLGALRRLNTLTVEIMHRLPQDGESGRLLKLMQDRYAALGAFSDQDVTRLMRERERQVTEYLTMVTGDSAEARQHRAQFGYRLRTPEGLLFSLMNNGAVRADALPERYYWRIPFPTGWHHQICVEIMDSRRHGFSQWQSVRGPADRRQHLIDAFLGRRQDSWYSRRFSKVSEYYSGGREFPWAVDLYRSAATTRLIRTALLCGIHRFTRGSWPESLDSLASELRVLVPACPVNEVDPMVRPTAEGGFLLWYPGLDGDDDGGKALERPLVRDGTHYTAADGDWGVFIPAQKSAPD